MNRERRQRIEALCLEGLSMDEADRVAFLDQACGDDAELRREVESLLAGRSAAGAFLALPAWEAASLAPGTRLGPYEIEAEIGAGGMGEVYKARDTRLDRTVAIKILPTELSADPERRARFEREAKTVAGLSHPHICPLFDVGQYDGQLFLVMEHLQGETLADRLLRGPLPLERALTIATEIADALSVAHRQGVTHRDLKPGNVMVTKTGAKLLDFGLAKLTGHAERPAAAHLDSALLQSTPLTAEGMIVGTLHYMAPEQVEGKPADARTDLWALGAILYEMLTGKRAFQGASAANLITAIMGSEPASLTTAEPLTPPGVDRLVRRCLAKDPDERWQSAHDVAAELRWMHERIGVSVGAAPVRSRWRVSRRGGWVATGVGGAAIAAALVAWLLVRQTPPIQPTAASLTSYSGSETQPSFSPDGQKLAFVWDGENGDNQDIYVKQIGSPGLPMRLTSSPVAESQPAWSPDDRWIAFARSQPSQQNVAVFLIPPLGGPERKLTEAAGVGGLSWTPDAKWLVLSERDALRRLSIWAIQADTGERRQLTRFEGTAHDATVGGLGDSWPSMSPDGRALAFARQERNYVNDLYMLPLGHDLRPAGEPVRVTRRHYASMFGIAWTANSREVIYAAGGTRVLPLWRVSVFGQGAPTRLAFAVPSAVHPAIAPKTSRLIYAWQMYNANLWRMELPSGERKLLVGSTYDTRIPQYSRDGTKIAFQSNRSGNLEVWRCDADGSDCLQLTSFNGPQSGSPRWSPDGRWIVLGSAAEGWPDVYVIAADGGMPRRVTKAPGFSNTRPSWSADGRWLYFTSNRSGRPEIWKVPAGGGQEVQVTRAGGAAALCSPDGKFIYYVKEPFRSRLFRMPADGGDEQVVTQAAIFSWSDFAVTAKGVYYLTAVDGKPTLYFLDMTTGRVAALADLPSITGGLCVSPDDRFVTWSQLDRNTIDLMLVENFR